MSTDDDVLQFLLLAIMLKRAPPEGYTFTEDEINAISAKGDLIVMTNGDTRSVTIRIASGDELAMMRACDARWMRVQ